MRLLRLAARLPLAVAGGCIVIGLAILALDDRLTT